VVELLARHLVDAVEDHAELLRLHLLRRLRVELLGDLFISNPEEDIRGRQVADDSRQVRGEGGEERGE
jgi:hypothetical protein